MGEYLAGISDSRVTIEELVAEGDKVAVRRSSAGTHWGKQAPQAQPDLPSDRR